MNKVYNRIIFSNGTTPALNATNLNAISKGLDDLDDRVVSISGAVLETVPKLESDLEDVSELADKLEEMTANPPYIGANGNWYIWDTNSDAYVDSGVDASITITVGTVTSLAPGSTPTVVNVGTSTDPIFNFGIPQGAQGTPGLGDMDSSVYDPTDAVANAGGIVDYIDGVITAALTASY